VGHEEKVRICSNVLAGKNVNLVIEGARGVGTTSFANLMRFNTQEKKTILRPLQLKVTLTTQFLQNPQHS